MFSAFKDYGSVLYGFPPVKSQRFIITEAQIRTLFTVPITLIPAVSGIAHQLDGFFVYRELGTAYGAGAGNLQLKLGSIVYYGLAASEWLAGTGPFNIPAMGFGNNSNQNVEFVVKSNAVDNINKALTMNIQTSDPTGGSGRLFITLLWRDWTVSPPGAFSS